MNVKQLLLSSILFGTSSLAMATDVFTIYPIPQEQVSVEGTLSLTNGSIQVICGPQIDDYTKARILSILAEHGLAQAEDMSIFADEAIAGKTPIYLGVNASADAADALATSLGLKRDIFSLSNKYDQHILSVQSDGIVLLGKHTDAVFYGLASLEQILDAHAGSIPCGTVYDFADQKNRGLVEGYYGVPYSIDVKKDLMRFMMRFKMNSYMYGAKNDPYHKDNYWKVAYPTSITNAQREGGYLTQDMVREITSVAHATKVNFIWAVHPGNEFLGSSTVVSDIMKKYAMMYDLGVRQFAVFVDDVSIPSDASGYALNATRVTELQKAMEAKWNVEGAAPADTVKPLQFVPQIYCYAFAGSATQFSEFFTALANTPKQVDIYTTGWGVWSVPNSYDVNLTRQYVGRDIAWWWNYPCNDNDHTKLFPMDMYTNFADESHISNTATVDAGLSQCLGVLSNPMQQGEVSKIALFGVADYAWHNSTFNNATNWEAALQAIVGEEKAEDLKLVCRYLRYYDSGNLSSLISAYKTSLKRGAPDGAALQAEMTKLASACASIQALGSSESESDRLLHNDLAPWLNKLEAMVTEVSSLLTAAETSDAEEAKKWTAYVVPMESSLSLESASDYAAPQLSGSNVVKTRNVEPAQKELRPFVTYLVENALGTMLSSQATTSATLFSNVPGAKGRVQSTTSSIALSSSTNTLEKNQYVGIALAQPTKLTGLTLADTILTNYTVLYSPNGRDWNVFDSDASGEIANAYTKYVVIMNESESPRSIRLVASRFSLLLPQATKITDAEMPSGTAWDGHTASYFMDGDYTTFSTLNRNQEQGDSYVVTLSEQQPVYDVRLCMGTTNGDYPSAARIETSLDGKTWVPLTINGYSTTNFTMSHAAVRAYSDEMSYCDFKGTGREARYVRLYVSTANTSKWLRLYEIEVNKKAFQENFLGNVCDASGEKIDELSDGSSLAAYDGTSKSIVTYFYSASPAKSVKIYQNADALTADASISVSTDAEASEWTTIGTLESHFQEVSLEEYSNATAVKIEWNSQAAPRIYEIIPVFSASEAPVISSIEMLTATDDAATVALEGGMLNIQAATPIKQVAVYSAEGRLMQKANVGGQTEAALPLNFGRGVNIIVITFADGSKIARKAIVR